MPWREKERAEQTEARERQGGKGKQLELSAPAEPNSRREGKETGKPMDRNLKEPAKEWTQEVRTQHAERPHTETTMRL